MKGLQQEGKKPKQSKERKEEENSYITRSLPVEKEICKR